MLGPFLAFSPPPPGPVAGAAATATARSLRDAAVRRGSGRVLTEAVEQGLVVAQPAGRILSYRIEGRSGRRISALVGLVRVDRLHPHETTFHAEPVKPAPPIEIRPVLAISEAPLPEHGPAGAAVAAKRGRWIHTLQPVDLEGPVDLGPLVLVDGHHRRRAAIADRGPATEMLTMVVGSGGDGLEAGAFQRLVPGGGELPSFAADLFHVERGVTARARQGRVVWVGPGRRGTSLRVREDAARRVPSLMRRVPVSVAAELLFPLLDSDPSQFGYHSTTARALSAMTGGDAAILLPRVPFETVLEAALAGALLPSKATRFSPKPLRGLVMRGF